MTTGKEADPMKARQLLVLTLGGMLALPAIVGPFGRGLGTHSLAVAAAPAGAGPGRLGVQPPSVEVVGEVPGEVEYFAVQGTHLYWTGSSRRLHVVDISDRARPQPLGQSRELPGEPAALRVDGNYAYIACRVRGLRSELQIVDTSTPAQPVLLGTLPFAEEAFDVAVAGRKAYLAAGDALRVVDVSDPRRPFVTGEVRVSPCSAEGSSLVPAKPIRAIAVEIDGNHAYLATGNACDDVSFFPFTRLVCFGMRVIDVSDSYAPLEVSNVCSLGEPSDLALASQYLYAADFQGELAIYGITSATSPTWMASYYVDGVARSVAAQGAYAYFTTGPWVSQGKNGLSIVRVWPDPTEVHFYDTVADAVQVEADGPYIYLAELGQRVHILRLKPWLTNPVYLPAVRRDVRACEGQVYQVKEWDGNLAWECDSAVVRAGTHSIRLQSEGFSDAELYSPLIPVLPNRAYEVSYWVKTALTVDDAQVYGRVLVAQYDQWARESDGLTENRLDPGFSLGENVGAQQDWLRKSYSFTTHAQCHFVRLRLPLGLAGRAMGVVWFDGVHIDPAAS
jgi:hypothetical protein